jgi:hypothetical protein
VDQYGYHAHDAVVAFAVAAHRMQHGPFVASALLQLNGVQIDFSDSSDPHPGSSATQLPLTQDSHVDIAASTIGDFGSSDFSIEFTFTGNGVDETDRITPDGTYGSLFIRSSQSGSPYTGPSAFIWNNGDIKFRMRGDDAMMCSGALPNPKSATARVLKFTVVQSTLSLFVDSVQSCSMAMTKTPDTSQFVSAPLRLGGNHVNSDSQNLHAKLSSIKLDDASGVATLSTQAPAAPLTPQEYKLRYRAHVEAVEFEGVRRRRGPHRRHSARPLAATIFGFRMRLTGDRSEAW